MELNWDFAAKSDRPSFVVQQLDNNYMLRLESNGVMKTWILPKGPTMTPSQKRLALPSRDLPMELVGFEGVTKTGQAVLLWDMGTYEHTTKFKQFTPSFEKALASGHLQFILNGEKLKGEFILRKIKRGSAQWMLSKKTDEFSTNDDVKELNLSVKSKKSFNDLKD